MTADARARAIEAGAKAMERYNLGLHGPERRIIAAAVLAAVEPIIRADERTAMTSSRFLQGYRYIILADLRAKAMNLPYRIELDEAGNEVTWMRYADVLALLEDSNE